ncbi:hypothetical protein AVEN_195633-1 [Araneus ventricosus]|uniref:Uncharacterized protein n=1 Tax=Araneus ventricosus TaxID=182803 RepID=A0A4Y2BA38_ARAVE|nr:hypothetical protein AVEN_195633-1 [Araneus ventricosus]
MMAPNTGYKSGVIVFLQEEFKKFLQWLVCRLHFNELLLRHVFEYLDGETTGPCTYSGPIRKSLVNCENLLVASFKPVYCDLPVVTVKDQKYLLDISDAVLTGVYSDLSRCDPGPTSNARWLTTTNRILRLYVRTEEPSSELIQLVRCILRV